MPRATDSTFLIGILIVVASIGAALAAVSISTGNSFGGMMGGGMMNGGTSQSGAGGIESAVLLVSVGLFLVALVLLFRTRRPPSPVPADAPMVEPRARPHADMNIHIVTEPPAQASGVPEMTLVKLFGEDEERMYLEIRERGGAVLQRDLVALGTFSKAKVTRVLDRLERKGIVVRERHGMTNRVRLVHREAD